MKSLFYTIAAGALLLAGCGKKDDWSQRIADPVPPSGPDTPAGTVPSLATARSWLVDKNATEETAALFFNLKRSARTGVLFGHQDATKRGLSGAGTGWANEQHLPAVSRERSDVKEVTGAYPVVYGHDFLHIANFTDGAWFDYERDIARQLTIDAYDRGGVNTYAWHYGNPVSKGSFYWNESPVEAVGAILPGGSHHETYKHSLGEVAGFAQSLVGADGKPVPVIFRPFHEFDGDWFWWGQSHCTPEQYKALYQFTVTFLRDSLGVRNFLYAWSPDRIFQSEAQYLERYPGDAYVDLVGMDNYGDLQAGVAPATAGTRLRIVSDYAKKKNKLAALTETGLANLTRSDWYTQQLLKVLQYQPMEIAYALVWANTTGAFWTPYKGHAAEADFRQFKASPFMVFADERTGSLYRLE
ncbi:MAG TPA: glycosyl hydrolase [Chitinophagaceae bacterium]|jgi:mannan endo-1,4-beta-mannosidase|nr:glycosyl hydrolase [Chitinophagaceae bacterium]